MPSSRPSIIPTGMPSDCPSIVPSASPSSIPSSQPTVYVDEAAPWFRIRDKHSEKQKSKITVNVRLSGTGTVYCSAIRNGSSTQVTTFGIVQANQMKAISVSDGANQTIDASHHLYDLLFKCVKGQCLVESHRCG